MSETFATLVGSPTVQGVHEAQTPEGPALDAPSQRERAKSSRVAWLRRWARVRRRAKIPLLLFVPVLVVSLDFARRGKRILGFEGDYVWTYVLAILESVVLWGCLLLAASRQRGAGRHVSAVLLAVFATFAIGGQSYFFEQYNAYLNMDVSVFASNFMDSVVNQLFADIGNYLRAKLPILAVALVVIWAGRRTIRPRRLTGRIASVLAPIVLIASFFIPTQHSTVQAATPDVLYMNAVGGLLLTQAGMTEQSNQVRPRLRNSLPVPPLSPASGTPKRNVVFVILESVRASATCIEHDPTCRRTEKTNKYFPERFPFTQMRSVDSCTAISLAVLEAGLYPTESREILHTWPLLFDYAKAAGYDTAY
ncbi:MAG TPA: hypothetical protein VF103_13760, partial [Polyangiaceae bacterium]